MGKRLFIATKINIQHQTYEAVYDIQNLLGKEKIKWTNLSSSHLTLKFLGDTDETLIPQIKQLLQNIALSSSPTTMTMRSVGVFPDTRRPRVLWIGLDENPTIINMAYKIDQDMETLGYEPEKRDFKPHITLGRIKFLRDRRTLEKIIDQYRGYQFQQIPVNEIILYESELRPEGPRYTALTKFKLHG